MNPTPAAFRRGLLAWYRLHRRDFPWRNNLSPYRVLVAELFLQRTQAKQVVPVFRSFLRRYPTPLHLAKAHLRPLRRALGSLGLIGRARILREMARQIVRAHGGLVPMRREELLELPGIGPYVASAMLCFASGRDEAIVDANVVRVLQRVYGFRSTRRRPHTDNKLWDLARRLLPKGRAADFNYGILDLAALVCLPRNPRCSACPLMLSCAWATDHAKGRKQKKA